MKGVSTGSVLLCDAAGNARLVALWNHLAGGLPCRPCSGCLRRICMDRKRCMGPGALGGISMAPCPKPSGAGALRMSCSIRLVPASSIARKSILCTTGGDVTLRALLCMCTNSCSICWSGYNSPTTCPVCLAPAKIAVIAQQESAKIATG